MSARAGLAIQPLCCPTCCTASAGKGAHVRMRFAGLGDGTVICVSCGYELPALAPALEAKALQ